MQENMGQPRVGRDNHIANEQRVFARARRVTAKCGRPVFVNGDHIVIRWIFRVDWLDGMYTHLEELAYQRGEGERIAVEQFVYDPAQLTPRPV